MPLSNTDAKKLVREILSDGIVNFTARGRDCLEEAMKCMECGAEMTTHTAGDYPYIEAGIEGVYLDGVKVSRCKNGHEEVAIPQIEDLHREIALAVASRPARLRGAELRFVRKYLGFSGVDFAPIMGVTPETLSRWENDKEPMGATAERLARVLVQRAAPVEDYPLEQLASVGKDAPGGVLSFKSGKGGWRREEVPT